jgi:hypothetical protein
MPEVSQALRERTTRPNRWLNFTKPRYCLGEFGEGRISVLGDGYGWETIGAEAEELSRSLSGLVGAIGCFDEDIMVWSLYKDGNQLQGFAAGDLEMYEMEQEDFDFAEWKQLFQLNEAPEELEQVVADGEDFTSIVEQLEKVLGLPLWMKYDWVEDDEELAAQYQQLK